MYSLYSTYTWLCVCVYIYINMEVNNEKESDSMEKIEKQNNQKAMKVH